MIGEMKINGYDAYSQWGVTLGNGSLSALMTPPPMKSYITNESAASHGKIVANSSVAMPKVDSRDVQLTIYIYAKTASAFYARYQSFVAELQKGIIELSTKYQSDVLYRLLYVSCSQFSQFNGKLGKFTIKFNEPNPMNRNVDD